MSPAEMAENADGRVLELKEKLEMYLMQLWEEQYDEIRKKKEQHATEVWTACILHLGTDRQRVTASQATPSLTAIIRARSPS